MVTVAAAGADLHETAASVLRQDYPELRHDVVPAHLGHAHVAALVADATCDAVLWLAAGDLLAPGALTALALEAALTGAVAVAGLRVLFTDRVLALDTPGTASSDAPDDLPFTGGEVLWMRGSLSAQTMLDANGRLNAAAAWSAVTDAVRGTIGRPVLLQRVDRAPAEAPDALSIVSLTGTGTQGGAGVAQRRLAEALALAGHRVTHVALSDRPEAAEWTDDFPTAEATVAGAGPDLILAGNLHGATRSLDVVGRLARGGPVALVLHDLFPLTGRCCHPRACTRAIAGCDATCPGPDEYPQLAPNRIAGMHARKRAVLSGPAGPWLLANSDWTLARALDL
ncbi:MAG: glycosyl transferase family 1, partial [Methylobacterium sp.]